VYSFVNHYLGTRTAFPDLGMIWGAVRCGVGRNCALKMALKVAFCTLNAAICTECLSGRRRRKACAGEAAQAVGDSRRSFMSALKCRPPEDRTELWALACVTMPRVNRPSGALSFGAYGSRFAPCRAKYNRAVPTVGRPCLRQAGCGACALSLCRRSRG